MSCACGRVLMPSNRVRVVCGFGLTIASLLPTRAFNSVDLPTLGRPTRTTKPQRNCDSVVGGDGGEKEVCRATTHAGEWEGNTIFITRRRPTWRITSRVAATCKSWSVTTVPSSRTPPCRIARRASLVDLARPVVRSR